ncbi:MAG: hypothetical protein NZ534_03900, partial [Bacteroidia bacterium]|nr:hypothetical protein [Bacteroidia bacterium]
MNILETVQQLRKEGKTDEAREQALAAFQLNPDDRETKQALAWTLHDQMKKAAAARDIDRFLDLFEAIVKLDVFDADLALKVGWVGFKGFKRYADKNKPTRAHLIRYIPCMQAVPYEKPSDLHSILLNQIVTFREIVPDLGGFIRWWNFDNLTEEDYKPFQRKSKTYSSLAEKAFYVYANHLLEINDLPNIRLYYTFLERLGYARPEYKRVPLYKARCLVRLGEKERAAEMLLSLIRQKKNEQMAWAGLAEIYEPNPRLCLACYCKSLLAKGSPENAYVIRTNCLPVMLRLGFLKEAKTEYLQIEQYARELGEPVPDSVAFVPYEPWYESVVPWRHNRMFYLQHSAPADDVLYRDVPQYFVVITGVNEARGIAYFRHNNDIAGHFKTKKFRFKFEKGDVYVFRLIGVQNSQGIRYEP